MHPYVVVTDTDEIVRDKGNIKKDGTLYKSYLGRGKEVFDLVKNTIFGPPTLVEGGPLLRLSP